MLKNAFIPKNRSELEIKARDAIRALVDPIPGVLVEVHESATGADCDFEFRIKQKSTVQTLHCQVRSRAWPNEIYALTRRASESLPVKSVRVLIAPYFSPQAIDTCTELGLSWADLAGNGELRLDGAYIKVLGNPNPLRKGRGTASLYSPQSSRVVHSLLLDPYRAWTTEELAKSAGVSLGQVSSVKKLLETNKWLEAGYRRSSLLEPGKVLEDWSQNYNPRRKAIRLYTLDKPEDLEAKIQSTLSDYAFTELSAAHRYAPFTRHQRVAVYVNRWREDLATRLGLSDGDGASNVTIYETGTEIPFIERINGSICVSPIQTYLDLRQLSGRGQDAAKYLLESVIEQRWT